MKIFLSILLFLLFILWTYLLKKNKLINLDKKVYSKIKFSNKKTKFFRYFTNLASTIYFVIICLILLLVLRNKISFIITSLMLIDACIVFVFKHLVKRERPNIKRLVKESGYSYPSGHTFSATCFYGFLMFLINIYGISLLFQISLTIVLLALIITIGYSRIYLGVHYFSDVIGGLILSSSYLFLSVYLVSDILKLI